MNYFNFKKSSFFVFVLLIISLQSAIGQEVETDHKNSIYGSLGTVILSNQASLSYERMLFKKGKLETRAKLNYGSYLSNNFDFDTGAKVNENHLSLSAVQLFGILELNAGAAFVNFRLAEGFNPDPNVDYTELLNRVTFYGNIGVRYSKNRFLFRAGIGNLELLYLGLGLNF